MPSTIIPTISGSPVLLPLAEDDFDLDLWLDFETRSRCNLREHGVYNYAQHPSTTTLCMSYAFGDEDVVSWRAGEPFPARVARYLAKRTGKGRLKAFNAAFERLVFWYVVCPDHDLPEPELELFYCTAAESRSNCGPGKLEDVGGFCGASMRKDHRGAQLIRLLSIPQVDGSFRNDPDLMDEMVEYCEQDVRAMRAASAVFRPLSDRELYDYHVNERINDRGVRVDRRLSVAAQKYAAAELKELQADVLEITEGDITSVRSPKMRDWVIERLSDTARKLCVVHKTNKETKEVTRRYSIDKAVRANLITLGEESPEDVPPDVLEAILCVDDIWASSTAKFRRLADLADVEDDRVRGAFVFAGGVATGRFASYGAQVHNMPRKVAKNPEEIRDVMVTGGVISDPDHEDNKVGFGKRVNDVLKKMLRPALLAEAGKVLVIADWSSIEARVTPWASNCDDGDDKLDQFRNDLDVYIVNAAATFNKPYDWIATCVEAGKVHGNDKLTEAQKGIRIDELSAKLGEIITEDMMAEADRMRQVGKVQELACGFMGGIGAFNAMGRIYGVVLAEEVAIRMVRAWRRANPWSEPYWKKLKNAYMAAMRHPGREFEAGCVTYMFDGNHLWYALPSDRVLCYPFARVEQGDFGPEVSYAKASFKPSAGANEWPRARLWPGLACENITQAIAADLLREALANLEDAFEDALDDGRLAHPAHIILHCHDEVVVECAAEDADVVKSILTAIMTTPPEWCEELPLGIGKPAASPRYGK